MKDLRCMLNKFGNIFVLNVVVKVKFEICFNRYGISYHAIISFRTDNCITENTK